MLQAVLTHTYAASGTYNAVVTVSDGRGGTATATVRIDVGNTAPVPVINTPTATQLFRVGEIITLSGVATDAQDGSLPNNRLTWEVFLHHNNDHTHPYVPVTTGNNITFTAPAPEDLPAAAGSFLEIRLTATDSNGLSATVIRNFQPRKVNITLATQPAGLNLTVNEITMPGGTTFVSWDGYGLNVAAPNQTFNNQSYVFQSWSDDGALSHTIITPANPTTYTASFRVTLVTVVGRVVTATGRGIPNARITMTDRQGITRTVQTNSSGYYRFTSVLTGETYAFSITTKNSRFNQSTQTRTIVDETSDVNFAANN
jgi:hypothetical protein